jgi:hypothetical protein
MKKTTIEWRVRPVTRYTLTKFRNYGDGSSTVGQLGEFTSLEMANEIGKKMAADEPYDNVPEVSVIFDGLQPPAPRVRAKMICTEQTPAFSSSEAPGSGGQVRLAAVWAGAAEDGGNAAMENRIFSKATPCAFIDMRIESAEAFTRFERGREYYVDFTPVPIEGDGALLEISGD